MTRDEAENEFIKSKIHPSFESRTDNICYGFKAGWHARDKELAEAKAEVERLRAALDKVKSATVFNDGKGAGAAWAARRMTIEDAQTIAICALKDKGWE